MRDILALLLLFSWLLATPAQQPSRGKQKDWEASQPDAIHAPALAFGADLAKQTPDGLRKWAEPYAKKELREKALDPQGTMKFVDQRLPNASEEARDAVTFLLFYLAYKEEDFEQRMLASRLRDIDRETTEITRQLQIIWKNEQNRSASPMQGISQQQRVAIDEQVQKMESQLRALADERQLKSGHFETSRKKVDAFLKLLGAVYPRMQGVAPAILQSVQ